MLQLQTILEKLCLIRDPKSGGSACYCYKHFKSTKAINLTGVSGSYVVDEKITHKASTGAVGKVVEWDSSNSILYYIQTRHNDEGVDSQTVIKQHLVEQNVITGQTSSGTPTTSTSTINNVSFTSGYSVQKLTMTLVIFST